MTLLELVIATTMLTLVMAAVSVVLRTGRLAWEAHAADYARVEAAHATLRHIVRRVRQARSVETITPGTDDSGRLALRMPDGSVEVWDHDGGTSTVQFGITNPTSLLSPNIAGLRLTGYRADGQTVTTDPVNVRAVQIEVTIQLPVETGGTRTVSAWAWLRSW